MQKSIRNGLTERVQSPRYDEAVMWVFMVHRVHVVGAIWRGTNLHDE